ncbi:MAG: cyanase, partial [Rhodospirillales bacterium]|nr:cyanase [Rhodospirillales bacterium]
MTRAELSERILDIKRAQGWSWAHIHQAVGGVSPILVTAALLGQMRLPALPAKRAAALFGLSPAEERMLTEPP